MNPPERPRTFIAKHTTLTSRLRAYALPDAIEIEERVYSLQRRRVLFDEVQLLTLHRRHRWVMITVFLLGAISFMGLTALFYREGQTTASGVCGGLTLLFLLISGFHLARPANVLTIASRRNKEEIQFGFREGPARQWFGQLQRSIRETQAAVAEEVARQNAAIGRMASMASPLPMPPSAAAAGPIPSAATPTAPATPTAAPHPSTTVPPVAPAASPTPLPPIQEAASTSEDAAESPASPPPPPDFMPPKG